MKKYILLFFYHILFFVSLTAQTVQPTFSTPIYFEDGVGNRDTVTVGYDFAQPGLTAAGGPTNLLNTPWDSIFEVRVYQRDANIRHEYKNITTWYSGGWTTSGEFYGRVPTLYLKFNIKYLPLKITLPLAGRQNNRCIQETYIDVGYFWFAVTPPDQCPWVMNNRDTVTEYFSLDRTCGVSTHVTNSFYAFTVDSIEGGGVDSLREIYLFMNTPQWFVGNEEVTQEEGGIYPNPSGGSFVLDFGDLSSAIYQIHDALGRLVVSGQYQPQQQLSLEQPGLYFVSVREEDTGTVRTSKLVIFE